MYQYLKNPYPLKDSLRRNLLIAVIVSLFIFFISIGLHDAKSITQFNCTITELSFVFAMVTFVVVLLVFYFIPKFILSDRVKENWTILNEIILIFFLHVIISSFNILVSLSLVKEGYLLSFETVLYSLVFTFLFGFFPTLFIHWIDYTMSLKQALKKVLVYNDKLENKIKKSNYVHQDSVLRLPSNKNNDAIVFDVNDLILIKSEGNYIEVYTEENGKIIKSLYRFSLQVMEESLSCYQFVLRVHRSFIVNIYKVNKASGNARNYQLFFKGIEDGIPVSRNKFDVFVNTFDSIMSTNHK